jgi:prevent-host-death family protein
MKVSVADAKNKLPELIRAAEDGETVTICRRGVPAVDIVRTKKPNSDFYGLDRYPQGVDTIVTLVEKFTVQIKRRLPANYRELLAASRPGVLRMTRA